MVQIKLNIFISRSTYGGGSWTVADLKWRDNSVPGGVDCDRVRGSGLTEGLETGGEDIPLSVQLGSVNRCAGSVRENSSRVS